MYEVKVTQNCETPLTVLGDVNLPSSTFGEFINELDALISSFPEDGSPAILRKGTYQGVKLIDELSKGT